MGELEEKIKKELLKSGFPLQVFCQRCLLENDWDILGASEYYISEPDIKKQVDVVGISTEELDDKAHIDIDYEIFIECKKSEDNPWVFFKEENPMLEIPLFYSTAVPKDWTNHLPEINGLHFNKTASSLIYTMAFKKKSKTNQIYEAVSSVLLSYRLRQDFLERHKQMREAEEWTRGAKLLSMTTIVVSFLTILLEGKLYLANVEKSGTVELAEATNIVYCQTEVKFPKIQYYTIDIVNRDYFPNYLRALNKDRELTSEFYRQEISKGGER